MKRLLLLVFVTLLCLTKTNAQSFTTNVDYHALFDSSYVVGQGMIDSFDIGQKFQAYNTGQFVLCHNAVLTFKGNQSSSSPSFYLYPGATLILKDTYFYPTIYMSDSSVLKADSGTQNIICYRESSSILMDTVNVNWITDSVISGTMMFTFSAWPNSSSPCTISPPQSIKDIIPLDAKVSVNLNTLSYSLETEGKADLVLLDLHGRKVIRQPINAYGHIDVSNISSGIYVVMIEQKGAFFKQKIRID